MAPAIRNTNNDVTEKKSVHNDKEYLNLSYEARLLAWTEHYQGLLNVKFLWDNNSLNNSAAVEGPTIFVTQDLVIDAINKMKQGNRTYHRTGRSPSL